MGGCCRLRLPSYCYGGSPIDTWELANIAGATANTSSDRTTPGALGVSEYAYDSYARTSTVVYRLPGEVGDEALILRERGHLQFVCNLN